MFDYFYWKFFSSFSEIFSNFIYELRSFSSLGLRDRVFWRVFQKLCWRDSTENAQLCWLRKRGGRRGVAAADGKRPKQPPAEETVGGVERYPNFKNCRVWICTLSFFLILFDCALKRLNLNSLVRVYKSAYREFSRLKFVQFFDIQIEIPVRIARNIS